MTSTELPLRTASEPGPTGPVGRFLHWWWGELAAMLPGGRSGASEQAAEQLVFRVEGGMLVCRRQGVGEPEELGQVPVDEADSEQDDAFATALRTQRALKKEPLLLLPQEWAATLPVTLPAAAKDNLRQVLSFEMDRQTPFSVADVYYDYRLTTPTPVPGSLQLELVTVPRRRLDRLLARLRSLGVTARQVDVVEPGRMQGGSGLGYNLLPSELRPQRKPLMTPINIFLLAAAAVLLVTVLLVPLVQLYRAKGELESQVAAARVEAEKVAGLRSSYEQQVASFQQLLEHKQKLATNVQVIGELATLLPDDTWLSSLAIKRGKVSIQGESDAASALIGLLEDSPLFDQTSFTSPVTQNSRTNKERFAISSAIGEAG